MELHREVPLVPPLGDVSFGKDLATVDVTTCELPNETYVFPSDISLQFVPYHSRILEF